MSDLDEFLDSKSVPEDDFLNGQTPAPKEEAPSNDVNHLLEQFSAGQSSGLVMGGLGAVQRAAGRPIFSPAPPPKTLPQSLARTAGIATAMDIDALAAMYTGSALPQLGAAVRAGSIANPKSTAALIGATYGSMSPINQYAESGEVDPKRTLADMTIGGMLGLAPAAAMSAYRAAKEPVVNAYAALRDAVGKRFKAPDPYQTMAELTARESAVKAADAATHSSRAESRLQATRDATDFSRPTDAPVAGDVLQRQTRARIEQLGRERDRVTEPILEQVRQDVRTSEAAGRFPDATGVQSYINAHNLGGELSIEEGGRSARISDYLQREGQPAQSTYQQLATALKSVETRIGQLTNNDQARAVYTGLRNQIDRAMQEYAPSLTRYKTAYSVASEPINEIMQGGSFAAQSQELQRYVRRELTGTRLRDFEQNPEKVMDSFFGEGERGAQKIVRVFGDVPNADRFVRGDVARRVQGMTAEQMRNFARENDTFLRNFPGTYRDLLRVERATDAADAARRNAEAIVRDATARQIPVRPVEAKLAIEGFIERGDVERLRDVSGAIRRQRGSPELGHQAVANYYSSKLNPVLDAAADKTMTSEQTASALRKVADDWRERRTILTDSGLISPDQAKDVQTIMDNLSRFGTTVSSRTNAGTAKEVAQDVLKHQSQLNRAFTSMLVYEMAGYKGVLAERMVNTARDLQGAYRNSVQNLLKQSITDPQMAHSLAESFRKKGPSDEMLKQVLLFPAMRTERQEE